MKSQDVLRLNIAYGIYDYWYDKYQVMTDKDQTVVRRTINGPMWDSRAITGKHTGQMSIELLNEYKAGNTDRVKCEDHFPSCNQICLELFEKKKKATRDEFLVKYQECKVRDITRAQHKGGLLWNIIMVPRQTPTEVKNANK